MALYPVKKELVYAFWAKKDSTGVYPYGEDGSISNGDINMMARAQGAQAMEVTQAEPAIKTLLGDGGVWDSYRQQPVEPVRGNSGFLALDQALRLASTGVLQYTEGQHAVIPVNNSCVDYGKLCLVLNYRAALKDDSTGVVTHGKWWVEEYLDVEAFPIQSGGTGDPSADPQLWTYSTLFRETSKSLYGKTFTVGNYNLTRMFLRQYSSDNPVIYGTVVGNGSTAQFTIPTSYDPSGASATYMQCWDDGTEQTYGSSAGNFELNSSNNQLLDFATPPESGSIHVFKLEFQDGC